MTTRGKTFFIPTAGRWSGGGTAVLANFRHAAERHPQLRFDRGDIVIVNRNFSRERDSRPKIMIPQNAWAWHGPRQGAEEYGRALTLRVAAEVSMQRALGVVRVSRSIPAIGRCYNGYLPNPLDPEFDLALRESNDLRPPVTDPYFVTIGSMHGYRGVESVVDAFSRYRRAGGRTNLHIIGGGGTRYVARIASLIANLPGVAIHPATLPRPMCLAWTRDARAAILPSHVEASPFSLLEALVVQPNVVSRDIAGHHDIVPPGMPTAQLFKDDQSSNLSQLLHKADDQPGAHTPHPLADDSVREHERIRWGNGLITALNVLSTEHDLR